MEKTKENKGNKRRIEKGRKENREERNRYK